MPRGIPNNTKGKEKKQRGRPKGRPSKKVLREIAFIELSALEIIIDMLNKLKKNKFKY